MSTLFLELISILVNGMYFLFFICEHTLRSWTDKEWNIRKVKEVPKSGNVAQVRDTTVVS